MNDYIKKQWQRSLLISIPLILIMINGLIINPEIRKVFIIAMLFTLFILLYNLKTASSNMKAYFKSTSADLFIDQYKHIFSKKKLFTQDYEVWDCYFKSIIYCYYGCFDEASEVIGKINWNSKHSFLQSLEISINALIHYLRDGDYVEGLRLFRIAKTLRGENSGYLLSNADDEFVIICIDIGHLLTEEINLKAVENLEQKFKKVSIFQKILIAWCLSKVYKKMNRDKDSNDYIEYCRNTAPHCRPFLDNN